MFAVEALFEIVHFRSRAQAQFFHFGLEPRLKLRLFRRGLRLCRDRRFLAVRVQALLIRPGFAVGILQLFAGLSRPHI